MLSACKANNKKLDTYLEFNHYHQRKIREIINIFTEDESVKKIMS